MTAPRIVVIGNRVEDCHVARRWTVDGGEDPLVQQAPAGAAVLRNMLSQAIEGAEVALLHAGTASGGSQHAGRRQLHLWAAMPGDTRNKSSSRNKAWRVCEVLGEESCECGAAGHVESPDGTDLLVWAPDQPESGGAVPAPVPAAGARATHVLIQAGPELLRHDIRRVVDPQAIDYDKLTLVTEMESLRLAGLSLSQGLSWDRTIEELAEAIEQHRLGDGLSRLRRMFVLVGQEGVACFGRSCDQDVHGADVATDREELQFLRMLYLPASLEGDQASLHPGSVPDLLAILTASVAMHLLQPVDIPRNMAIRVALDAIRRTQALGGGDSRQAPNPGGGFNAVPAMLRAITTRTKADAVPLPEAAFAFRQYEAAFANGLQAHGDSWRSDLLGDLTGHGADFVVARAAEVVYRGIGGAVPGSCRSGGA